MPPASRRDLSNVHALYAEAQERSIPKDEPLRSIGHQRFIRDRKANPVVNYDPVTCVPIQILTHVPAGRLSEVAVRTPPALVALEWVRKWREFWNLTDQDARGIEVVAVSVSNLPTVRLMQYVAGKEVFNSDVCVALSRQNEVIGVAGQFFSGAGAVLEATDAAIAVPMDRAIAKAASELTEAEHSADEFRITAADPEDGPYRYFSHESRGESREPRFQRPIRTKEVLFPLGRDRFVHGYYIEIWASSGLAFSYVVAASTSLEILFRRNASSRLECQYQVFNTSDSLLRPEDSPAPGSPHPNGIPDRYQAPPISETIITVDSLLPGRPWLPDDARTTTGNNCIAYADNHEPDGQTAADVITDMNGQRGFYYRYNQSQDADYDSNIKAGVVAMFFHINWLHDRWYEAGFDEGAGNAQTDNFGLDGLGRDPILAEGNDFAGSHNANMTTFSDGDSPKLQIYVYNELPRSVPTRCGNIDAMISFHEVSHYMSDRLVGNAGGLTNQQGQALREGFGDFIAICMTSQSQDAFVDGAFPSGGWTDIIDDRHQDFYDNYYFGRRRYPYSTDMRKNPLTFRHIRRDEPLPGTAMRNPQNRQANHDVHNAGEVWCSALWELFVALCIKHGHAVAERLMLEHIIRGLKTTPLRPTFTQARDAIIGSIATLTPADLGEARTAFAKRGLGVRAVSPPQDSVFFNEAVENFDVP